MRERERGRESEGERETEDGRWGERCIAFILLVSSARNYLEWMTLAYTMYVINSESVPPPPKEAQ